MSLDAFERVTDALEAHGRIVKPTGTGKAMAQCPAHDDRTPSLSIAASEGQALMYCHAGCQTVDVIAALDMKMADLFDKSDGATYRYDNGRTVHRTPAKQFLQGHTDKPPELYRLAKVRAAVADDTTVYVVEGEKDVHALELVGVVATCSPMGAGKWALVDPSPLYGGKVVIVADRDEPGRRHAQDIYDSLVGHVQFLVIVEAKAGKDAADHIAAGHGIGDFLDALSTLPDPRATVPPHPTELAEAPRILDFLARDAVALGVAGERRVVATTYLTVTSRLLDKQASLAIKGHSASGKSHAVQTVVGLFPPEAVCVFTGMSERALIYSKEEYAHRTIVLYEAAALREKAERTDGNQTAYFLRSLLSEGRISYDVTIRNPAGAFTTKRIVKEGPTNLILTTTQVYLHGENETRMLSMTTNDSREQTSRVLAALADETAHHVDIGQWVQLQQWLAGAEHRVTVPYASRLASLIPPIAVRLRRDFGTLLALIRAHAILHQLNRDRYDTGRIIASLDGYEVVRELIGPVLSEGAAATVSPTVRETTEAVIDLDEKNGVPANTVAERLKLDKSAARRRLLAAADAGYVQNLEDKRGRPGRWRPAAPLPDDVDLLPPCSHLLATTELQQNPGTDDGGGTVATNSGRVERDELPLTQDYCRTCGRDYLPDGTCPQCHLAAS
jgi:5S rRNA maturation endonuclease (ribonuclease M5)/energy-coupling factor transporter ATP-binding protein EcfA2